MSMTMSLAGKISVVTGGGSGIGRAICSQLARAGARVLVVDLKRESAEETCSKLEKMDKESHSAFGCDVSLSHDVSELRAFTEKKMGCPSVVINCAGITLDSTLLKLSEENFDKVIAVNLKGVFLMTREFARFAVTEKRPLSVINISSIVGKMGNFGQTNYAASKAGVIGFTKSAAMELASKNIRSLAAFTSRIPLGRMGEPEEIANAAFFLASDMSKYMTGAMIEVTGGLGM